MIILLLILAIIVSVICFVISFKYDTNSLLGSGFCGYLIGIFGCFVALVMIILTYGFTDNVISGKYIDEKKAMYQEENANIEEQIDALVKNYMKYESDTFSEFKGEGSMTLVSLYPELKSDELVQNQISVYTENNKKIKELKEQKIDVAKSKWWLYFGK